MLQVPAIGAQGTTWVRAGVNWGVATVGQGSVGCGTQGIDPVPIPSQVATCHGGPTFPGFSGVGAFDSDHLAVATARADLGLLGASSVVQWFSQKTDNFLGTTMPQTSVGASADAAWKDQARFAPVRLVNGLPLGYMDLTFDLDGTIAGVEGLNLSINGQSYHVGTATAVASFFGSAGTSSFFHTQTVRIGGTSSSMPALPRTATLRIGINALVSDQFRFGLSTFAGVSINALSGTWTLDGFMSSDFAHTLTPVSYRLFDTGDQDVTADYTVSFDNGLQLRTPGVGDPTSTVPEPSTWALLAGGLVILGATGRLTPRPRSPRTHPRRDSSAPDRR